MKTILIHLKFILINIFIIFGISNAAKLKGVVYGIDGDNNKIKLAKATVFWLGTQVGTFADDNGNFTIERLSGTERLVVRYVGYQSDTITVDNDIDNIEIVLKSGYTTSEINVFDNLPSTIISKAEPFKSEIITSIGLQKAACCNLSESFTTNPSVDVNFTDALTGAKQIQLLGLQGIYTQLLTEKIPNNRGLAAPFGLEYIPGPWMESIQISKGAATVSTGYESITGQINVEYKKPETGEPLFLNGYVNHFGRVEANLISDFQISDNLSTMILGNGNFFNQEIDHNGDSFLDKPMMSQLNLMNRWKYQGEVWESISGAKVLLENRKGGQSGFYILNDPKLYGIKINTQRFEFFSKNGFVFPGDKYRSLGTIVSAIYHKQNSFFGSNEYDANQFSIYTSIVYQSVLDEANQDISIEESFEKSEHKYSLGFSFILDNYNEDINGKINKRIESVPGFFAEYAFGGIPDLNIIGGLRADYHNLYGLFFTPRLHIKYQLSENTVFRASAGKGYRVSRIYAENSGLFASSRLFFVDEELKPEVAWNFGLNSSTDFFIGDILFTLNAEYYRTDFINQVIIDTDRNPGEVHFYNLKGKSYSNSFQVDLIFEPISGLNIMTAYRLNDVKMTIYDELLQKPLLSKHKAFLNIGYAIGDNDWLLDFTADYNGRGRLPNTSQNPEEYRLNDEFEDFILFNTQITKKFDVFEMYLGIENITDYKQKNPILGYNDPNGKYFDSTIIWGPIIGRLVYFGFRLNIN